MATKQLSELWFPAAARQGRVADPKLRVLCFHNAGSAESMYTQPYVKNRQRVPNELLAWAGVNQAEILAVQLPGREARRGEAALRSCQSVAAALLPVVAPLVRNVPYAIVGHSVGTWNSFELLCLMRGEGLPMPRHIFYSCFASPDITESARPWTANAQLPTDGQFQHECRGWDVNEVVFSKDMWNMYKDLMRADFTCFDTYKFTHADEPPLGVPMTTFYAQRDKKITSQMVAGWEKFCGASFEHLPIAGHHLFPYDPVAKASWLQHIVARLPACIHPPAHVSTAGVGHSLPPPTSGTVSEQEQRKFAVRWAFDIRGWLPSQKEWDFALSLLSQEEADRVR